MDLLHLVLLTLVIYKDRLVFIDVLISSHSFHDTLLALLDLAFLSAVIFIEH